MNNDEKRQRYLETTISTASKEELTLKIFDYLILSATQAIDLFHNAAHDVEAIHLRLRRGQKAIALLMGSLNFEIGGELSTNLFRVYEWWHHELVMANMQRDPKRVERLLPFFKEYRETWAKAIAQYRQMQRPAASASSSAEGFVAVG